MKYGLICKRLSAFAPIQGCPFLHERRSTAETFNKVGRPFWIRRTYIMKTLSPQKKFPFFKAFSPGWGERISPY